MADAIQQIARLARALDRLGLRALTSDEVSLITAAVEAGAKVRADCALEDYIVGTRGLPVYWSAGPNTEHRGEPAYEVPAAAQRAKEAAFMARCSIGDLSALAERVQAARVSQPQAEAA